MSEAVQPRRFALGASVPLVAAGSKSPHSCMLLDGTSFDVRLGPNYEKYAFTSLISVSRQWHPFQLFCGVLSTILVMYFYCHIGF
jgi:hypothetical protein